ncbi:MAG: ABC transporter substrate-binding protein [Lachnospiraceae bacterium]|nr:ABC transporter substrate-binding protein [Lachnospiraceae bacterium]
MKARKILSLMLILCLAVSALAGCSKGEKANTNTNETVSKDQTEETAPASSDENEDTKETAEAAKPAEETNETSDTITVTDHNGNEVTLNKNINRIVVCDIFPIPAFLSVFFDSADKIVGMAGASMTAAKNSLLSELYPEILNASTSFIDGSNVNIEELALLDPDLVIYSASSKDLGDQLLSKGFPAVAVSVNKWDYDCIETLNNWIALFSEIFPENDKTAVCREYSEAKYKFVQDRVKDIPDEERQRAFFLFQYSDQTILTSGRQFFGQWWADAIGAVNVATELEKDNSVAVNMEQIYAWDPSLIFITNFNQSFPQDLYDNTVGNYDWSEVNAVKNKNVYKMPLGMYRSYTPGVDCPVTLLFLAKLAYPDLFADVNITEETKAYYKEVFGIELTDAQADSIFNPSVAAGDVKI